MGSRRAFYSVCMGVVASVACFGMLTGGLPAAGAAPGAAASTGEQRSAATGTDGVPLLGRPDGRPGLDRAGLPAMAQTAVAPVDSLVADAAIAGTRGATMTFSAAVVRIGTIYLGLVAVVDKTAGAAVAGGVDSRLERFGVNGAQGSAAVLWAAKTPARLSFEVEDRSTIGQGLDTVAVTVTRKSDGRVMYQNHGPVVRGDIKVRPAVGGGNQPPNAAFTATPTTGKAPLAVAFDAAASRDPDGTITGFGWDFGDGTTGTGTTVSHIYLAPGSYTVVLTVADDHSATGTASRPIDVRPPNVPPQAVFTATPTAGPPPLLVAFDATASTDSDGTIKKYTWVFGDGTAATATTPTTSHVYLATGQYPVTLTVTDNDGAAVKSEPPVVISVADVAAPVWPDGATLQVVGVTDGAATIAWPAATDNVAVAGYCLYQDGTRIADVDAAARQHTFSGLTPLTSYTFRVQAVDAAGNETRDGPAAPVLTLPLPDTEAPSWPDGSALTFSDLAAASVTLHWPAADDNTGVTGYRLAKNGTPITNAAGQPVELPAETRQYTVGGLADHTTYTFAVTAVDAVGNVSAPLSREITTTITAPPLDPTVATNTYDATKFLYTGPDPVQIGVAADTIAPQRAAVLHGKVTDRADIPLDGVTVTVLGHPEFGQTRTRSDGLFDLAVNGGGQATVDYYKDGYLPSQRQVDVPWQDYVSLPDVVLIRPDAEVTTVDLASSEPMQVAQGSKITDGDGTRQVNVLFPQGTTAEMVQADGTRQPLQTLHVRATEYTVGENGPKAMPAELPATSAYTYAFELTADEALAAGARDVNFDHPVPVYTENFLDYPVGEPVPLGYYDTARGAWVASDSGRIIKILTVTSGEAVLDTDGDDEPDAPDALNALGITDVERRTLAGRYRPGQSLWRMPIPHFSGWDSNWGFGPPADAEFPKQPRPDNEQKGSCGDSGCKPPQPCVKGFSTVNCPDQAVEEDMAVTGTPYRLHYGSDRQLGRTTGRQLPVRLLGDKIPGPLKAVHLEVDVAGQHWSYRFACPCTPNLTYTFVWNGRDVYGRVNLGRRPASVRIGYEYEGVALSTNRFGYNGGGNIGGIRALQGGGSVVFWQSLEASVDSWDARMQGELGGWTLNVHHAYDPESRVFYGGDGERRSATSLQSIIDTVAGGRNDYYACRPGYGDGGPAVAAHICTPSGIAVARDGTYYVVDSSGTRVRRITPDGIITTVAGSGVSGYAGDGGPATLARIAANGIALGPDDTLYVADYSNHRIRHIDANGIITTVAGTGIAGFSGDGGPARDAAMSYPIEIAFAPDGSMYIADAGNYLIRRIGTDGIISTVAGTGTRCSFYNNTCGDGGPAAKAGFAGVSDVAVGPDGSVYVTSFGYSFWADARVRRITPDGIIRTFAGPGNLYCDSSGVYCGDGGPATNANVNGASTVTAAPDGRVYIGQTNYSPHLRVVGTDGIITTVTGAWIPGARNGTWGFSGDGGPAPNARLSGASMATAIHPDGTIYIVDGAWSDGQAVMYNNRIRTIAPSLSGYTGTDELTVASKDGTELYVFDTKGRHLRTLDTTTGAVKYAFEYLENTLSAVTDGDGNRTTFVHDNEGVTIAGPDGQNTRVTFTPDRYASTFTNPAGESVRLGYETDGLLAHFVDQRQTDHRFTYDAAGRVLSQTLPGNRTVTYSYDPNGNLTSSSTTSYTYTPDRLLQKLSRPDGVTETGNYDSAGRVTKVETPTGDFTLGYDPAGRLDSVAAPGGSNLAYGYDGPLPTSQTWTGPTASPVAGTVTAGYDSDWRVNSLTVNGTDPTAYKYDADSLLTTAGALSLTRRPDNGLLAASSLGTVTDTRSYNTFGEPQNYTAKTGSTVRYQVDYDRDSLGRLTTKTETVDGTTTAWTYRYDPAGRLDEVRKDGVVVAGYTYDLNGNRTSETTPSGTVTASYDDQDRLLTYGATSYTYTANGELATKTGPDGTTTYTYDTQGNLTHVTLPHGTAIDYLADGQNRRIGKKVNGQLVQAFLYQNQLAPAAELDGAGNIVARYVYATHPNVPDYIIKGDTAYRVITDQLGSPRLIINTTTGDTAQRVDYDAWGNITDDTNPSFQPFGFAGGLHDHDTGLVRFSARDYDPIVGRWTAKDQDGFASDDANLYVYGANDTVDWIDPTGLKSETIGQSAFWGIVLTGYKFYKQVMTYLGIYEKARDVIFVCKALRHPTARNGAEVAGRLLDWVPVEGVNVKLEKKTLETGLKNVNKSWEPGGEYSELNRLARELGEDAYVTSYPHQK